MEEQKIKIFISYSHEDEKKVINFEKYFEPLKSKYKIDLWRDIQNKAGEEYEKNIDEKLNSSDIILLFISDNFLSSNSCKNEKEQSLKLKKQGVVVIPVILSTCEWQETEIKNLLAIPKDGKSISDFDVENNAWKDICQSIKKHIEYIQKFNSITLTDKHETFLEDTPGLTTAHHNKQTIRLSDIFVPPKMDCYNELRDKEEKDIDFYDLEKEILKYKKIVIVGDKQSGKTALCKRLFSSILKNKKKLPVYISYNEVKDIKRLFYEQYQYEKEKSDSSKANSDINFSEFKNKIIPIIDDFHKVKDKQKIIENIEKEYGDFSILVIDDIYGLDITKMDILKKFKHFKVQEFNPTLRDKLINKWQSLTDNEYDNENKMYKEKDEKTELVNTTLGKVIGNGIVPSYPFFILAILSSFEGKPLDENITSQGHCYQALIYLSLRKIVKDKDIDIYLNFLTEIAYAFLKAKKKELSPEELDCFIREYQQKYILPNKDTLLKELVKTTILRKTFENIQFQYEYIYFYFVAKFLSEHIDKNESKKIIKDMIENLHKNENAYIIIFVSHHLKNDNFLNDITKNARSLFKNCTLSSLTKDELDFLDKKLDYVIDATLPSNNETVENEREKRLEQEDREEKLQEEYDDKEEEDAFSIGIRRTIKTIEVMGRIIKNRSGSLEKLRLEEIFKEGMNAYLRLLKSFLDLIKEDKNQFYFIEYIRDILEKINKESTKKLTKDELKKLATLIFWNFVFCVIYNVIDKTIHSLGSDNLREITNKVCDDMNTPASFLIKHGILMWYSKNIQVDNIINNIKDKSFSDTAKRLIKYMIVGYCYMHKINYKDKSKLVDKFNFKEKELLLKK